MRHLLRSRDPLLERLPGLDPGQQAALRAELAHIGEYLETVGAQIRRSVERGRIDDALALADLAGEAIDLERLSRI
jgi:hypothetical protein